MTTNLDIHALRASGKTLREIAARVGLSDATVWRRLHLPERPKRDPRISPFQIHIRKRCRAMLIALRSERVQPNRASNWQPRPTPQRRTPERPDNAAYTHSQATSAGRQRQIRVDRAATFMRNHDRTSSYASLVFGVPAREIIERYNAKYGTNKQLVGPVGVWLVWS